jgi:hypothetical protein
VKICTSALSPACIYWFCGDTFTLSISRRAMGKSFFCQTTILFKHSNADGAYCFVTRQRGLKKKEKQDLTRKSSGLIGSHIKGQSTGNPAGAFRLQIIEKEGQLVLNHSTAFEAAGVTKLD